MMDLHLKMVLRVPKQLTEDEKHELINGIQKRVTTYCTPQDWNVNCVVIYEEKK